jgi:hypothetical protein
MHFQAAGVGASPIVGHALTLRHVRAQERGVGLVPLIACISAYVRPRASCGCGVAWQMSVNNGYGRIT